MAITNSRGCRNRSKTLGHGAATVPALRPFGLLGAIAIIFVRDVTCVAKRVTVGRPSAVQSITRLTSPGCRDRLCSAVCVQIPASATSKGKEDQPGSGL
jgi:hypothetical protein